MNHANAKGALLLSLALGWSLGAYGAQLPFEMRNVAPLSVETQGTSSIVLSEYREAQPPELQISPEAAPKNCRLDRKTVPCLEPIPFRVSSDSRGPQRFKLSFESQGKEQSYTIQVFPDDFPVYTWSGKSRLAKNIVFSLLDEGGKRQSHLLILGPAGNIVFYRRIQGGAPDLRPHRLSGGRKLYSYLEMEKVSGASAVGHRVLLDQDFKPIKTLPFQSDFHEFQVLSDDRFLTTFYEKKLRREKCLIDEKIQEYDGGKLLMSVGIFDLMDLGLLYGRAQVKGFFEGPCLELFHMNSARYIAPDTLLIGMGWESLLAYNTSKKKIEWIFGGPMDEFGLDPSRKAENPFFLFHSPVWDSREQSLVLFDNGLTRGVSRILEYRLDLKNKKIIRSDTLFEGGTYSDYLGSVEVDQVGDEKVLSIGWGHKRPIDPSFSEVSSKRAHLTIRFKNPNLYSAGAYRD